MTDENAPAAGDSGAEPAPVPPPSPHSSEAYRRFAVEELALHLMHGSSLLAQCKALAEASGDDPTGPILAAARLMNANAKIAKALTEAAGTERRSRMIVEVVQRPDPQIAGLNSTFASLPGRKAKRQALRRAFLQLLQDDPKPHQASAIEGDP